MRCRAFDRRRFLVAAALLGLGSGALRWSRAWAQSARTTDEDALAAMTRLARHLYPHDGLADEVYAAVVDEVAAATAANPSMTAVLEALEAALDAQAVDFLAADGAAQIAAMSAIEHTEAFAVLQAAVRLRLYEHPSVWALIGYGGPSYAQGGYLGRGAGAIDWLPEAR